MPMAMHLQAQGATPTKGSRDQHKRGLEFLNGLVKLEKPDGLIQFTIEAGGVNSLTLGTRPKTVTAQKWSTGPFRAAYVTAAPTSDLTISAGQIGSLEGYESGIDWRNFNMMTTSLWDVENAQSVGVTATYTHGPFAGSIAFSDGFDTNVWNYLQLLASYSINDNNEISLFGATNLGATGLNAGFYGNATRPYSSSTVAEAGAANLVNSSVIGGYYSFTSWQSHAGAGGAICLVNQESRCRIDGLFQPFRCRPVRKL